MANAINFVFDIDQPAAPIERSINSGSTWAALPVPTTGTHKDILVSGIPAAAYAVGVIQVRPVGYPAKMVSNTVAVTVAAAAAGATIEHFGFIGQSNSGDKSLNSDAATAPLSTFATLNAAQSNLLIWSPTASAYQAVQNGVNDLSLSNSIDVGSAGGGTAYTPARGIAAGALALRLADLYPATTYRLVKFTSDGNPFSSVTTGGARKAAHDARWAAAKAATESGGNTWHLKAVKVQFGETDYFNGTTFASGADAYVSEMLANGFAQANTLYCVVGLMDAGADKSAFRAQQLAWVNAAPTTRRYLDPLDYQGQAGDTLHQNGVTQMQIANSDFPNAVFGVAGGFRIVPAAPAAPSFAAPGTFQIANASGVIDPAVTPSYAVNDVVQGGDYATMGGTGAYIYGHADGQFTVRITGGTTLTGIDVLFNQYAGDLELVGPTGTVLATANTYAAANTPTRIFAGVTLPGTGARNFVLRQKAGTGGQFVGFARFIIA